MAEGKPERRQPRPDIEQIEVKCKLCIIYEIVMTLVMIYCLALSWSRNEFLTFYSTQPIYGSASNTTKYNCTMKTLEICGDIWGAFHIISIISLSIAFIVPPALYIKERYALKPKDTTQVHIWWMLILQSVTPLVLISIATLSWVVDKDKCFDNNGVTPTDSIESSAKWGISFNFDIGVIVCAFITLIGNSCRYQDIKDRKRRRKKKNKKHAVPKNNKNDILLQDGLIAAMANNDGLDPNEQIIWNYGEFGEGGHHVMANEIELEPEVKHEEIVDFDRVKSWYDECVKIPSDEDQDYASIYWDILVENGFDNAIAIRSMTDQDLIDIDIDKLGHRKTIMTAISQL